MNSSLYNSNNPVQDLHWLQDKHPEIFNEVIVINEYQLNRADIENKNIIDIGANVGMFSILAAYLGAKRVIAAEPASNTFEILKQNVKQSNFKTIEIYKNIVLNITGAKIKLPLQNDSGHNSLFRESEKFETAESISLNDMIMQLPNNEDIILKIDCEGSEYDIILNANKIDFQNIKTIHIEIHSDMHPYFKGFDIIENKILSFGYTKIRDNQMFGYVVNDKNEITQYVPLPVKVCCYERIQ